MDEKKEKLPISSWDEFWGPIYLCPYCGEEKLFDEFKFCPFCGRSLKGVIFETEEEEEEGKRNE